MTSNHRRPTQRDVAREAGVSQAMVSYVLNDVQSVSMTPSTRERVLAAMVRLGYVPNNTARSLRSRRTGTIAVIIPDITNPYYPEFVRGVQDIARRQSYDVLAFNTDGDPELESSALSAARRNQVDGIVITPFFATIESLSPILNGGTPITMLKWLDPSLEPPQLPIDAVSISGQMAAHAVVSYLIERGHSRIGMIAGQVGTPPREDRVLGYRQALAEHHMPLEEMLIRGGDFTEAGGQDAMRELLSLFPRPTAVFAANDLMAMGALLTCRERGIDVPSEIALAGFDNIPAARLVHPSLTTLDQYAHRTGSRAAELLLSRLDGSYTGPMRCEQLPFDLIARDSA